MMARTIFCGVQEKEKTSYPVHMNVTKKTFLDYFVGIFDYFRLSLSILAKWFISGWNLNTSSESTKISDLISVPRRRRGIPTIQSSLSLILLTHHLNSRETINVAFILLSNC